MPVALGALAQVGLRRELRVRIREVRVREVAGVPRVGDVELHVAAVPVRDEHDLARADPLHDDVVVEDLTEAVRPALRDPREELEQVVLGDEARLPRVREVDDVDVVPLPVVDEDRVGPRSGVPGEDAVDLVGDLLVRDAPRAPVAEAFHQRLRPPRVGDVVEVEAAQAPRPVARLVVGDEDVAPERGRVQVQRLHPLARIAPPPRGDERDLPRARGIPDVDDVHAVPPTCSAPRAEVRVPVMDGDVRDLLPRSALQTRASRRARRSTSWPADGPLRPCACGCDRGPRCGRRARRRPRRHPGLHHLRRRRRRPRRRRPAAGRPARAGRQLVSTVRAPPARRVAYFEPRARRTSSSCSRVTAPSSFVASTRTT